MYLSKRQQEVLSMMSAVEKQGREAASLWAIAKGRQLHVSIPGRPSGPVDDVLSYVGYRTAYVLEGLGLIASCVDTDLTVGYRLTDAGAALVGLLIGLPDGCGFSSATMAAAS